MLVKCCGIRNVQGAKWAIELGYDLIGVVIEASSKRGVSTEEARQIAKYAREASKNIVKTAAVALRETSLVSLKDDFTYLQFYGQDLHQISNSKWLRPVYTFKEYLEHMQNGGKLCIYDKSRGSGTIDEIPAWLERVTNILFAGGISITQINKLHENKLYGVDLSSGLERDGVKDFALMQDFIKKLHDLEFAI